jgi:2-keto-4-pentenoate hydratase/2-oxohepta-3-ene-1,7-dioic acid hydratase in catechol pathway
VRLATVDLEGLEGTRLVVVRGDTVVPMEALGLRRILARLGPEGLLKAAEEAKGTPQPISAVRRWYAPVRQPRTFRDFYAFEQHVKTARGLRGQEVPPAWYEIPVFYFSNPTTLVGHREPVARPGSTQEMDFELEVACVISKVVQNVSGEAAEDAILGYMILNDLSARDLQRQEMTCMLGPAKGKDFATAVGPYLVTKETLASRRVGPGRYDLAMVARKNGKEISRGNMKDITWDFTQMIERASRDATLYPGDIIGSGTVGTGCILELGAEQTGGWLEPGDTIELEIDELGILTTPIT